MNRIVLVLFFSFIFLNNSFGQDCTNIAQWSATTAYANPNTKVVYQGKLYHNNFWTQGDIPSTHDTQVLGSGQPWTSEGTCLAGTDGSGNSGSSGDWNLQGNTITSGQFLGTINNQAFILKANNLAGLYVNPQKGSVSIGTAYDPFYYKFEVNGGLTALTGPNQTNQNNLLVLYSGNQTTAKYSQGFKHYTGFAHGIFSGEEYGIINSYEYNSSSGVGRGKHMLIQNTNEGNLGIGVFTAAPGQKLVVNGNSQFGIPVGYGVESSRLYIGEAFDNTDPLYISRINPSSDLSTLRLCIGDNGDANDLLEIGSMSTGSNVWTPGVRIGANGTLVAKVVCVNPTLAWCDYVFENDYKLMPLKELQTFIKAHKHLPEIPSTAEIEKAGLNVNELLTLQMKKIEELTLYSIQQDEHIASQAKEIQMQTDKVEELEARLAKLEKMILSK